MSTAGSVAIKGTVYGGPAAEPLHTRPAPSVVESRDTVYDPANHKHQSRGLDTSSIRKSIITKVQSASARFFVIAAISGAEYFFYRAAQPSAAAGSLATAIIFTVIGFFAMRMSRAAFVVGMLLYGADTAVLFLSGCTVCMLAAGIPLLIHLSIFQRLWAGYESLGDLRQIETI